MTDLITGATGFIGRHLARRLLKEGRHVRILCRKESERKLPKDLAGRVEIAWGDLKDRESLFIAARNISHVYHCAGNVLDWGDETDFREINVRGTRWLLEAALAGHVQRFIHLSSIAAFGTPSPAYFDDQSPYGKSGDFYSRTKAEAELCVFEFHKSTGLACTVLRPAVVYGRDGTWFEEPIKMIEQGKMFLLGGGRGTCHPCYVENLIDAMSVAANHPKAIGQGYIVADNDPITFKDYFNGLAKIAGKGPIKKSIPMPMARALATACEFGAKIVPTRSRPLLTHTALAMVTTQSRMSVDKIMRELAWKPRYDFRSAMNELESQYRGQTCRH